MKHVLGIIILMGMLLFAVGCTPSVSVLPSTEEKVLRLETAKVSLEWQPVGAWQAMLHEGHIILMEQPQPVSADGIIQGVIANIWLPETLEIASNPTTVPMTASDVLTQVVSRPPISTDATTSSPQAFVWQGYDGAYYVLNSGDGNIALVIALVLPESNHMLAFNLSANEKNTASIYRALANILNHLQVNTQVLGDSLVTVLPKELPIPSYRPQSAMEASPSSP